MKGNVRSKTNNYVSIYKTVFSINVGKMVDTENMVGLGQKEPYNESQELLQVNKAAKRPTALQITSHSFSKDIGGHF